MGQEALSAPFEQRLTRGAPRLEAAAAVEAAGSKYEVKLPLPEDALEHRREQLGVLVQHVLDAARVEGGDGRVVVVHRHRAEPRALLHAPRYVLGQDYLALLHERELGRGNDPALLAPAVGRKGREGRRRRGRAASRRSIHYLSRANERRCNREINGIASIEGQLFPWCKVFDCRRA